MFQDGVKKDRYLAHVEHVYVFLKRVEVAVYSFCQCAAKIEHAATTKARSIENGKKAILRKEQTYLSYISIAVRCAKW